MYGDFADRVISVSGLLQRKRTARVPQRQMSIIEDPFKRVAVDLMGPIQPATTKGYCYFWTVVYFCYSLFLGCRFKWNWNWNGCRGSWRHILQKKITYGYAHRLRLTIHLKIEPVAVSARVNNKILSSNVQRAMCTTALRIPPMLNARQYSVTSYLQNAYWAEGKHLDVLINVIGVRQRYNLTTSFLKILLNVTFVWSKFKVQSTFVDVQFFFMNRRGFQIYDLNCSFR